MSVNINAIYSELITNENFGINQDFVYFSIIRLPKNHKTKVISSDPTKEIRNRFLFSAMLPK